MKLWCAVVVMLVALCGACGAAGTWDVGALGGPDGSGLMALWSADVASPAHVGVVGFWKKGPEYGASACALYDFVKNSPIHIDLGLVGPVDVNGTAYAGVHAGLSEKKTDGKWDADSLDGFLTGFYFGTDRVKLGICEMLPFGPSKWSGISQASFVTLTWRF